MYKLKQVETSCSYVIYERVFQHKKPRTVLFAVSFHFARIFKMLLMCRLMYCHGYIWYRTYTIGSYLEDLQYRYKLLQPKRTKC